MCGKLLENQREVERYTALAKSVDAAAARIARGRPAIDVALGEVFYRLSRGELLLDVNATKKQDFANELGIPPREYFDLLKLGRALQERPLLKQAMLAGEVTTVKAFIVLDLAVGEEEAPWVARAMEESVAGLKKLAKEKGGTGGAERCYGYETLRLAMTPAQQDRLDYALFLARDLEGLIKNNFGIRGQLHPAQRCCSSSPTERGGLLVAPSWTGGSGRSFGGSGWSTAGGRTWTSASSTRRRRRSSRPPARSSWGPAFGRRFEGLRPSKRRRDSAGPVSCGGRTPRSRKGSGTFPPLWLAHGHGAGGAPHHFAGAGRSAVFRSPWGAYQLKRSTTGGSVPLQRQHVGVAASERSERSRVGDHGPLEEMAP